MLVKIQQVLQSDPAGVDVTIQYSYHSGRPAGIAAPPIGTKVVSGYQQVEAPLVEYPSLVEDVVFMFRPAETEVLVTLAPLTIAEGSKFTLHTGWTHEGVVKVACHA